MYTNISNICLKINNSSISFFNFLHIHISIKKNILQFISIKNYSPTRKKNKQVLKDYISILVVFLNGSNEEFSSSQ